MSWSTFLIVLVCVAIIYNTAIFFHYFKGDVSSMMRKKTKKDGPVLNAREVMDSSNRKSFVGLVQPDMDRSDNTQYRTESLQKISPTLKSATNGILVSDLETCLNEVSRNLEDHDPLSEKSKELIKDMTPEGEIHVEYDNGKNILKKRIDVFENIVQL